MLVVFRNTTQRLTGLGHGLILAAYRENDDTLYIS